METKTHRRTTVRNDLLITLFISGLIPVFIAVMLLYSQLHVSEQEEIVEKERAAQQVHGNLVSLLHASQSACDGVTYSAELNDFIQAPAQLRRFSENRLYGRIAEWEKRSPIPLTWVAVDRENKIVFSKGTDNPVVDDREQGIYLSSDRNWIKIVNGIHFDDQGLSGPNATIAGSMFCGLQVKDLRQSEPRLAEIESIPDNGDFNSIKIRLIERDGNKRNQIWFFIITVIGFLFAATIAGFTLLRKRVLLPLEELTKKIGHDAIPVPAKKVLNEIEILECTITEYLKQVEKRQSELLRQAEVEALAQVSNQVAHDIRSPLAALEMVLKDLDHIPEQQRLIVRSSTSRIRDISNDLLNKNSARGSEVSAPELKPELISAMVELIVTEKRMQYRNRSGVSIEADLGEGAYGLFSCVTSQDFKRVISNLVNNAVEAMESGEVVVSVRRSGNLAIVRVRDNGRGMPESVLEKLGEKSFSHGKEGTESGSGLGLYHAFRVVGAWGGSVEVESKLGEGTSIVLNLIAAEQPAWFLGIIKIGAAETPVVVDDDPSVLQAWQLRFTQVGGGKLLHFSSLKDFTTWFESGVDPKNFRFFFDYEFLGGEENGLDLVERLKLNGRSILVTSRYEEEAVRTRVKELRMQILPKGLVAYVPIQINSSESAAQPEAVLLDGDSVTHATWNLVAKKRGVKLACYFRAAELMEDLTRISSDTAFYLDSDLGEEKGEDIAKELFERGYKNLYLATGYPPSRFGPMPWIKAILGKAPPWL